jgi:DNA excision repair protein ERCC-2
MPSDPAWPAETYTVAVRQLCEFTARCGDLDLRFQGAPTGAEGVAGHTLVAQRRGPGYERELALSAAWGPLTVRGRADGYDSLKHRLEEVKTYRGRFESITAEQQAVHWAQVQIYGHLLCQTRALPQIRLALVYLNLDDSQETVLERVYEAQALEEFHALHCSRFVEWARQELAHLKARGQALQGLAFPQAAMREGQRTLARAVWHAARQGRCLLAQAPTGIGKTLGTVFPALKAMGDPGQATAIDKLYVLSAKSSGRTLAVQALASLVRGAAPSEPACAGGDPSTAAEPAPMQAPMQAPSDGSIGRRLRVLELLAREKACEHPDKACHGQSCPLAKGYYDKLPAARAAAVEAGLMDGVTLRRIGLDHELCPYHLGHEMLAWSDVVVGDYHHWFDSHAVLYSLSTARQWQVAVLVDEAHNLVERGRQMYSADLDDSVIDAASAGAPAALRQDLARLRRHWRALSRDAAPYSVLPQLPPALLAAMQHTRGAIIAWQGEHPTQPAAPLQRLSHALGHLMQRLASLDTHSLIDLSVQQSQGSGRARATLCVRNVVPAPFLGPRLSAAHCCVLFSATLTPAEHYAQMLGLPEDTRRLDVAGPFHAGQLEVRVLKGVSTRWADRSLSLPTLVEVMAAQWQERPGKYLAFFSSFDYLQQASLALQQSHPQLPQWQQSARMSEAQQEAFVERFRSGPPGIGFAVLGGSFAEGIDLPGPQLIGAFIATLGLPQLNPVNEQFRRRMEQLLGRGSAHAYLYPGLRKVVQAAGRVIRSQSDQGVLWLMDERFAQAQVRALLPPWWRLEVIESPDGRAAAGP